MFVLKMFVKINLTKCSLFGLFFAKKRGVLGIWKKLKIMSNRSLVLRHVDTTLKSNSDVACGITLWFPNLQEPLEQSSVNERFHSLVSVFP